MEYRFGEKAWDEIRLALGCDVNTFWPSRDYPDSLTVELFVATARHLKMTPDEIMIEFGKYWLGNTGKNVYPMLFALVGDNPRDFLRRLDFIHHQATISLPGTRGFTLRSEDLPDGGITLHYTSELPLCPVLHGLILGAGLNFNQVLQVEEVQCTRNGAPECVFKIHFPENELETAMSLAGASESVSK
ncbi:heme NO binding domain protein [Rhodopirellula sp. SWK7]|nr:heme NO binding domain protein [Rhodopirellula sp. SWK7]